MPTTPPDGGEPGRLSRRRFIEAGSVVALVPLLSSFGSAAAAESSISSTDARLSVGYLSGSESFLDVVHWRWEDLGSAHVVPARSLASGDDSLRSAARLSILGLYPEPTPEQRRELFERADLDLMFDLRRAGEATFHAWSSGPRGLANPGRLSTFVAVARSSLDVVLEVAGYGAPAGGTPAAIRRGASFTTASAPGRPRLRRGVYLLGLGPKVWARPVSFATSAPPLERLSLVLAVDHLR